MISFMPLLSVLNELDISVGRFIKMYHLKKEWRAYLANEEYCSVNELIRLCRKLKCEIKDVIEFIDEDGNIPKPAGYALCEEDRYTLPHKWTPLVENKLLFNLTDEDVLKYLHIPRSTWYLKKKRMIDGEWVHFSKETVKGFMEVTGLPLSELCEDIKPSPFKPLRQTLSEELARQTVVRYIK